MHVAWIYGPPGVGKSTTAWQLYCDLADKGVLCAYVDIDQLGMCYPASPLDPDRHRLKGRALAALTPNYSKAGAEVLVVSGVLEPSLVNWYVGEVVGGELTFCRLTVGDEVLRRRHEERGATAQDWDHIGRETGALDPAQRAHATVDTTGLTPQEVADEVRARLGIRVPSPTLHRSGVKVSWGQLTQERPAAGHVVWLCGPTGVGKSTAAWAAYSILRQHSTTAFIDLKQVGFLGDPDAATHHALQAANIASLWGCFHAVGATHLVLSGAIETGAQVSRYREALPASDLTLFRLRADRAALGDRVRARGRGEGPRLAGDWLVNQPREALEQAANRSWMEQERLDLAVVGDVVLETTGATPAEVAAQVLHPSRTQPAARVRPRPMP